MSSPESSLLEGLNAGQRAAVTAPDGPALVIAAAGTGKTRTLTHRVAWLVRERGIDPFNILLLTFTNRAAAEMLMRAAALMQGAGERPWGGTFHSVCNRILRRHAAALDFTPSFAILDEDDSKRLLRKCVADLGIRDKHFPKPDVLSSWFGLAASREIPLGDFLRERILNPQIAVEDILRVHDLYSAKKRETDSMDFDDLILLTVKLLRECPDVRAHYGHRFRHILVDEFQDTSKLQSSLVDLLAGPETSLMVVGDDFQSIFSWRGAEIENFLSFEESHPGTRVYRLEENYRSTPGILEVANRVIAGNPRQYQKTLRPVRPVSVKPTLVHLDDGRHQARFVIEKIMQLVDSGFASPDEIAVLYRSHFHAMDLQMELSRAQMAYSIVSGLRFFEQAHIKDICTLTQLCVNPANFLAFSRFVQLFPKVGEKSAEKIWRKLGGSFNLRVPASLESFHDALPADAKAAWQPILETIFPPDLSRDEALARIDRPDFLIEAFCDAFYKNYIAETFDNPESRLDDIRAFSSFSLKFESAARLLEELALLTNLDSRSPARTTEPDQPAIRLTTIHQAKGLEWKAVFVLWVAESMFPSSRSLDDPRACEEERRLFYVAVTRAKDYLWLCAPKFNRSRGDTTFCPPSRFIEEIDPHLLQVDRPPSSPWNAPAWPSRPYR